MHHVVRISIDSEDQQNLNDPKNEIAYLREKYTREIEIHYFNFSIPKSLRISHFRSRGYLSVVKNVN